jgi:hypothetical protein
MKRLFAIITLVSMISFAGCVDLDDLWSEINLLKQKNSEQLKELEEQKRSLPPWRSFWQASKRLPPM